MSEDLDTSTHTTRISRPLSPEQRARKQARFLKAYRESGNIKASCAAAGVHRQTYYNWRDQDEAFQAALPDAKEDACDTLEFAAYERAVRGVESYVVSMGRVVYEEIAQCDDTGTPKLDKEGKEGKQVTQVTLRGKPILERKYSDSLLITLLKANLPRKYKDKVEVTGKDDGPIEFETQWGGGALGDTDEEDEA